MTEAPCQPFQFGKARKETSVICLAYGW
jgi:hypothetical protein